MKKIRTSNSGTLPSVTLYREDLEEIIALLKSSCKSVTLSDGEYEFETLYEFSKRHPNSISHIEIRGDQPFSSVEFKRLSLNPSWLYASAGQTSEELYLKLREFLFKKKRIAGLIFPIPFWIPAFICSAIFFRLFQTDEIQSYRSTVLTIFGIGAALSLLYRGGFLFNVSTKSASQKGQFWETNKDKVFLAVISAIIGAIITWIAAKFK